MSKAPALSAEAVEFLLELLELPEPLLCGGAAELHPRATELLATAGLLSAHDYEMVTASLADHDDVPVSLFSSDTVEVLSYFSPAVGPVAVSALQLLRRHVEMEKTLAAITADLGLPRSSPPFEVVSGLLWEIGDVRVGKRPIRNPIWFARRLWDPVVHRQITEAARTRPHTRQRAILTSSRQARVPDLAIPGAIVVSLQDVLGRPESLAISAEILERRLSGIPAQSRVGPLHLSDDGTQLSISGGPPIAFRSGRQIDVIRKLVDAHRSGIGLPVRRLTELGSLRRFFGNARWQSLSLHLKSENGLWRFDV